MNEPVLKFKWMNYDLTLFVNKDGKLVYHWDDLLNWGDFYAEKTASWANERETGFEPATSYLASRHSTTELLPQNMDVRHHDDNY